MTTYDLPPEALAAISEVETLRNHAASIKKELDEDLARVRSAINEQQHALAAETRRTTDQLANEKADVEQRRAVLEALVTDRFKGIDLISQAWADYELALAEAEASVLRAKAHPAKAAAETVRRKGQTLAELRRRTKLAEWVVTLYESHFPWLTELRDLEEERSYIQGAAAEEAQTTDEDPAARWLSGDEYRALPVVDRNQRALDRYLASRKSAWQIGRDYERYVGYLREREGCSVTYQGIFKGLEDLGRDLLAEKDGVIEVIQCKRWARHKVIHEKHIFQLFGTVVATRIEQPTKRITGTFVTTTSVSERAKEFAEQLDIRVVENFPLDDYPRIKCNVSRATGERIYHLPFDQKYDDTLVEAERGEAYVSTVSEAEALGFRRAWRWHQSAPPP